MKQYLIFTITFLISSLFILNVFSQNLSLGLPEDIDGYNKWIRLNKKIIRPRAGDPHRGFKRVYVNKTKKELVTGKKLNFPYKDGTIIVKEVREASKQNSKIVLISIMRKLPGNESTGGWDFIEYTRSSQDDSFIPLQFPQEACYSCHQGASNSDSVWTKFNNF